MQRSCCRDRQSDALWAGGHILQLRPTLERVERLELALEEQQRAIEGLRREFAMRIGSLARREVPADAQLIALSFWPPIFGKQADAVKQFETLIGQLEGKPLNADHAQAWLLLGNLHPQQGQQDKALEIWQNGASLFPNDPTFGVKLGQ